MDEEKTVYDGTKPTTGFVVRVIPVGNAGQKEHHEYVMVDVLVRGVKHTVGIEIRDEKRHRGGVGVWYDHESLNQVK